MNMLTFSAGGLYEYTKTLVAEYISVDFGWYEILSINMDSFGQSAI